MSAQAVARLAPWSGIAFVVLMVGSFFTTPGDVFDPPEGLASDYATRFGLFLGGRR